MAEAQLRRFLEKVRQLNAFVALCEARPELLRELTDCDNHDQVVALAQRQGFEIGRRWGEPDPGVPLGASPPAPLEACTNAMQPERETLSLIAGSCPPAASERSELLLQTPVLRLERIHSCGASTPEGRWYDQEEHEWVALLQGTARLRFADETHDRVLNQGDSLLIRAGRRHRVTATDPDPGTIWLALFWRDP
jgi:cupin 2 domain-containing protein